jgi:hypothetical protein
VKPIITQRMITKEIVMRYFQSWQVGDSMDKLKDCLCEDFILDSGLVKFDSRDNFMNYLKEEPPKLIDVNLIAEIYDKDTAAILYEGYEIKSKQKMRVSEFITIENGLIKKVQSIVSSI